MEVYPETYNGYANNFFYRELKINAEIFYNFNLIPQWAIVKFNQSKDIKSEYKYDIYKLKGPLNVMWKDSSYRSYAKKASYFLFLHNPQELYKSHEEMNMENGYIEIAVLTEERILVGFCIEHDRVIYTLISHKANNCISSFSFN